MYLEHRIKKSSAFIFEHLTNANKFVSVHPVIYKMEETTNGNFLVSEKLNFIPFPFNYVATINPSIKNKEVLIHAVVMKVVKIKMQFELVEENEFTQIKEKVEFKSFLPVHLILKSIFKKQHNLLFKNIESAPSSGFLTLTRVR